MHIPDGFLDLRTWVTMDVVAGLSVAYAIRKTRAGLGERQIPLMGVMAAFIFAAQMLNFPIAGGTSGHFIGGVMAAVLLGPWAATLVMSTIFIVQCLLFQDGGLTALGANIFNMGIIGTVFGYYIYRGIGFIMGSKKGLFWGVGIASWLAVVLAATFCSIELAVSGTVPLRIALPAMAGVHVFIGVGEAIITMGVISLILKTRPDLLQRQM
ncbi:energy-coupling factor ABC transporter permease [bacterium]|nr:energy-coupling factor ABC transporter permease [bacterium]